MKILRHSGLYYLYHVLICCFLISFPCNVMALDDKEGESEDILAEIKPQVELILRSHPNTWKIIPYKDIWLKGLPVFCFFDKCGHSVVFAKDEEEGWLRLSGGGDFSGMNKVLKNYKISKEELNDSKALVNFLEVLCELYVHPYEIVLSKSFVENHHGDLTSYLFLDDNENQLKSLCANPDVSIKGDVLKIKFNILRMNGSVECWTLFTKHRGDHISVDQLTVSVLKPTGTYLNINIG